MSPGIGCSSRGKAISSIIDPDQDDLLCDQVMMSSILFVCTANRFRSPLAAAMFQSLLDRAALAEKISVESAGTWADPDLAATPEAEIFARKVGADLSGHRSLCIDREIVRSHQLIIVMEAGHKEALQNEFPEAAERIFMLSEMAGKPAYDIPDPYTSQESPAVVANELYQLLENGFVSILQKALGKPAEINPGTTAGRTGQ